MSTIDGVSLSCLYREMAMTLAEVDCSHALQVVLLFQVQVFFMLGDPFIERAVPS